MTENNQDWTERLRELKEMYPEGSIITVEKEDNHIFPDEPVDMIVTGYHIVESEEINYTYPGPRVCASTNPPDYEFNSDQNVASSVRPEQIIDSE